MAKKARPLGQNSVPGCAAGDFLADSLKKAGGFPELSILFAALLPVENCVGRVLAAANVGCPPAVPIVACGERIDENALRCFRYYGIKTCSVMKERP